MVKDKWLTVGALALGVLFVFLFYGKIPGVSVPVFITAFYALLLAYARPVPPKQAIFGWLLAIPVFMLAMTYFLYGDEVFFILDIPALLVLILLQTILVTGSNLFKWHSPDILFDLLYGAFYRSFAHITKPFGILSDSLGKKKNGDDKKSTGVRILAGLLISLPLLFILLVLLASADMVFGRLVGKIPAFFDGMNIGGLIGRIIVALIIFLISFSYIWSLGRNEKIADNSLRKAAGISPEPKGRWDMVTVITATAAVDALYAVFVVIQFAYLFGRSGLPDGFTYAEYARSGFFELLLVTLLNAVLLACTLTFTKKDIRPLVLPFRILNTVMAGCTFVMLCSAFYRMSLYEAAYGYTFLRIMTQAFMIFLLAIFIATLARIWSDRVPLLKSYIIVAIVAFTVVNYIDVDKMIAEENIERYKNDKIIDTGYFHTLSNDAVPEIMKLADEGDPETASQVKEFLEQRSKALEGKKDWQSFNLADYRARRALKEWKRSK